MGDSRYLTTADVAADLGYHRDTIIRNAAKIGGAAKILGRWRFEVEQYEAWKLSQAGADTWAAPPRRGVAS